MLRLTLSSLCSHTASGDQLRGSWPSMSPSPVLPSEEGNQHGSAGMRSHSFGGRRVLGERGLNIHPDRSPGMVNACWVLTKPQNSLSAGTSTRHSIKHIAAWLSTFYEWCYSTWLKTYMYVLKESCAGFWHVWFLTKEEASAEIWASVCNIRHLVYIIELQP